MLPCRTFKAHFSMSFAWTWLSCCWYFSGQIFSSSSQTFWEPFCSCKISFSWFSALMRFRGFRKPSELLGFYLNQNPNFEPFMVLHITSKCVSCLDIIPSGSLLTLCPLNKTEQWVGDQNSIQGSPPIDDLLSTTTTLIKDHIYEQPLFHGPLDMFSRQIFLLTAAASPCSEE